MAHLLTVVDGLRSRLKDPKLIQHFVDCYNDEHQKLFAGQGANREKARQRMQAAEREYKRIRDGYVKGLISEDDASEMLPGLRAEKERPTKELDVIPKPPKVVSLKPVLVQRYMRCLENLEANVAAKGKETEEVRKAVRELVSTVMVYPPAAEERPTIKVEGYLSQLVDEGLAQRLAVRGDEW